MSEKKRVKGAILVEGKYDKLVLSRLFDAPIFTTAGFGIFSNAEKQAMFRKIAEKEGLIVLTDSDPAGFVIRNKLKGMLPRENVIQLYAPEIAGKEKRKKAPSKAGILGIEGLDGEVIVELFRKNGLLLDEAPEIAAEKRVYTKADLYEAGLCGKADSAAKRDGFCARHGLPHGMTAGALLEAVNLLGMPLAEQAGDE